MNIFLIYSFQFVYNFYFIVFILYLPASYKINDDNNLCPLLKLVTVGNPRYHCHIACFTVNLALTDSVFRLQVYNNILKANNFVPVLTVAFYRPTTAYR